MNFLHRCSKNDIKTFFFCRKLKLFIASLIFLSVPSLCWYKEAQINKNNNRRLRILFVLGKFPWYTKAVILNQITGLLDRGHDVYINARKKITSETVEPEVEQYNLLDRTYYGEPPPDLNMYDIIVCQYGKEGKEFAEIKKKLNLRAKLLTFFRGSDATNYKETEANVYDCLFKEGDLFLPVCEYLKYRLILLGADSEKIKLHYSGINCDKFDFKRHFLKKREKIRILSIGRLCEAKGFEYTIRAVAELIKECPNVEYTIIGGSIPGRKNEENKLRKLIKALKVQRNVRLIGWMNQEAVREELYKAHIFVLGSVTSKYGTQEGIPNVLKEAMLTGLPVVATFHAGIQELVQEEVSGFLVPERDVFSLVRKIKYLIKHPDIWEALGKAAREKVVSLFDIKKLNDEFEQILLDIVN